MSKGWLSKQDFDTLDSLFGKMGYGSYYDFLECLKEIGTKIGAYTVEGEEIDREDLKTISEVMDVLNRWAEGILRYRLSQLGSETDQLFEMIILKHLNKKG